MRMADKIIPEIEGLLRQARTAASGEEKIKMLNQVKQLIDEGTSFESLPVQWMGFFGPEGLSSPTTVLACGWFRKSTSLESLLSDRVELELHPGTRRAFKNYERGTHAEIEMLECLTARRMVGRELRIVVSRAPCEDCLKRIIAFQERNNVKVRIGFAHWYRRSNLHQMYASVIDQGFEYTVLPQAEMKDGVFSPLFGSTLPPAVPPNWKNAMEQAWEDCYKRTKISFRIDDLCVKMLNKPRVRRLRAIRMMLRVFGVRFAFWRWHQRTIESASKSILQNMFGPRQVVISSSRARKDPAEFAANATKPSPVANTSTPSREEARADLEVSIALERCKV